MVYQWRELLEQHKRDHGGDTRILMTEAYTTLEDMFRYYGDSFGRRGSHVPFNFLMIDNINNQSTAQDYKNLIDAWIKNMPKESDYVPNWVVGNHDNHRVVNRFGLKRDDAINMLVQTLPGIAVTYNGEELVMSDQYLSWEDTVDPQACLQDPDTFSALSRDPARTPFQWDDSKNAGFSTANKTWLPVASNYQTVNVKRERATINSHLNVFKQLTLMRKTRRTLQDGSFVSLVDDNLLIYKREVMNAQLFVVLNLGTADQEFRNDDYFGTYKTLFSATVVSDNSGIRQG
jgi:alpha-glucosidase